MGFGQLYGLLHKDYLSFYHWSVFLPFFFLRFIQVFKAFQRGDPNFTIRIPILK